MARLTSDARKLSEIISWGCVDLLWGLLTMFGILGVLLVVNIKLAVIILIIFPIMVLLTFIIRKKMLKSYRDARKYNSRITAAYNEGFMGANASKSLVIEELNSKEFHSKALDYKKGFLTSCLFLIYFWSSYLYPLLYRCWFNPVCRWKHGVKRIGCSYSLFVY